MRTASSARRDVQRASRRRRSRRRRCAMPSRRAVRDDAAGDLAAVGDQDRCRTCARLHPEHAEASSPGSARSAPPTSAEPSTRRVSAGSMMPSSHSRARGVVGMALALVLLADRRLERLLLLGATMRRPCASMPSRLTGREHAGRLLAAHHARCARWATSTGSAARRRGRTCRSCRRRSEPPMMTVNLGTCAVATAVTILAPSLAMPPVLVLPADHEAGDVLQEEQRDARAGSTAR